MNVTRRQFGIRFAQAGAALTATGALGPLANLAVPVAESAGSAPAVMGLSALGQALRGVCQDYALHSAATARYAKLAGQLLLGQNPIAWLLGEEQLRGGEKPALQESDFTGVLSEALAGELDRRLETAIRTGAGLARRISAVRSADATGHEIEQLRLERDRLEEAVHPKVLAHLLEVIDGRGLHRHCDGIDLSAARAAVESPAEAFIWTDRIDSALSAVFSGDPGLLAAREEVETHAWSAACTFLESKGVSPEDFYAFVNHGVYVPGVNGSRKELSLVELPSETDAFHQLNEPFVRAFSTPEEEGGVVSQQTAERVREKGNALLRDLAPKVDDSAEKLPVQIEEASAHALGEPSPAVGVEAAAEPAATIGSEPDSLK